MSKSHFMTVLKARVAALPPDPTEEQLLDTAKACQPWLSEFSSQELAPLANAVNAYLATASSSASGEDLLVASKILEATELKPTSPTVAEQMGRLLKRRIRPDACRGANTHSEYVEFNNTVVGRGAFKEISLYHSSESPYAGRVCAVAGQGVFFAALTCSTWTYDSTASIRITIDGVEYCISSEGNMRNTERLYAGVMDVIGNGQIDFGQPLSLAQGIPFTKSLLVDVETSSVNANGGGRRSSYAYYILFNQL